MADDILVGIRITADGKQAAQELADVGQQVGDLAQSAQAATASSSSAASSVSRLGSVAAIAGTGITATAASVFAMTKAGIDAAAEMVNLADKTGISVESLSGLDLALRLGGASFDTFARASNTLSVNIAKNAKDFASLGISAKDPLEAMLQLSNVLAAIDDPQKRAAVGAKALGGEYQALAPLLLQGADAMREQIDKGRQMAEISTEAAQQAAALATQIDIVKFAAHGLSVTLAQEALPWITRFLEQLGAVPESLETINQKIALQQRKIAVLKNEGGIGGLIDGLLGYDINAEKRKLDVLLEMRAELAKPAPPIQGADPAALDAFIGAGEKAERTAKQAISAYDALNRAALDRIAALQRELALYGETGRAAALEYDIQYGALQGINDLQAVKLLNMAAELDQLDRNAQAQREFNDALEEMARLYQQARAEEDALYQRFQQRFNGPLFNLKSGIDEVATLFDVGKISESEAKAAFDKLGQAYNDSFIKPASEGTKQLEFMAQSAAQSIEQAFADFLFDPFAKGLDGMLLGFLDVIRRMIAQVVAAQIFGESGLNIAGIFSTAVGSLTASAQGNVFSGGALVPFAQGGVVDRPHLFPMRGGNIGLMGEAGPEAVMPLRRNAQGQLGVVAQTVAGGNSYHVVINVQARPDEAPGALGSRLAESFVRSIAKAEIASAARPGNALNQTTKFK